jgi:NAD(P)-dependent dehydrogenase (short-subunit alcohol dehydrogenase family)
MDPASHDHHVLSLTGVMGPSGTSSSTPSSSSSETVDHHMLVNHLGPFLLTGLLLPQMASGSRIVNVSSRAHFACKSLQAAGDKLSSGSDWW